MQSIESVNGLPFVVARWVTGLGDQVVGRHSLVLPFGTKREGFGDGGVDGVRFRILLEVLKVSMLEIADPVRGGASGLVFAGCLQAGAECELAWMPELRIPCGPASLAFARTSTSGA